MEQLAGTAKTTTPSSTKELYRQRMVAFVDKLWSNPAIERAPLSKRENQILSFVKENQSQLQSAFQGRDYFPALDWEQSVRLLFNTLSEKMLSQLEPQLEKILNDNLREDLFDRIMPEARLSPQKVQDFMAAALRTKVLRDHFIPVIAMIESGFFSRYLFKVMERRKVIYYEVVRRDHLGEDFGQLIAYIQLAALFRPFHWYRIVLGVGGVEKKLNLAAAQSDRNLQRLVMNILEDELRRELGRRFPMDMIRHGVESWLNPEQLKQLSGTSRLIQIVANRGLDYAPQQRGDRGAETPDKSWFNINRRSARYYGYDAAFLDELYQISAEEEW